jgi:hypothetical protein
MPATGEGASPRSERCRPSVRAVDGPQGGRSFVVGCLRDAAKVARLLPLSPSSPLLRKGGHALTGAALSRRKLELERRSAR